MRITPISELESRYKKLQTYMEKDGIDAVICQQNADLFYFTGTIQAGSLYIPVSGEPIYMVRREIDRAKNESSLKNILPFGSFKEIPRILKDLNYPNPTNIGMELDVLPVNFFERYKKVYNDAKFSDGTPLIRLTRMKKSSYEIGIMKEAAIQVDKIYRRVFEVLCEGISEIDLASELEYVARRERHPGNIRMRVFNGEMLFGHAISGKNSAMPSYTDTPFGGAGVSPSFGQGAGFKKIGRNEPIIIDFAGCIDGYLVDQTRIFSIGDLSGKLRRGYEDMLKVQDKMKSIVLEKPSWGFLYNECLKTAFELGYSDNFMGKKGSQVSFIGHGVGVEIDEYPFIARGFDDINMESGMVFAFEPKLIFPNEGAVGIENTFYITENNTLEQLTFSPENIAVI